MSDIDDLIASMEDFDDSDDSDLDMDMGSDIFGSGESGTRLDNENSNALGSDSGDGDDPEDSEERQGLFKRSLIYIIIAVVFCLVVLIVGGTIKSKVMNKKSAMSTNTQQNVTEQNINSDSNNSGNQASAQTQAANADIKSGNSQANVGDWREIDSTADIQFNGEYSKVTFTVTKVVHMVKSVPGSSDVMVVSKVMGSLAGMTGTYEFNIPYNKGIRLNVGASFEVDVLLGQYNGITVVGDIQP